MDKFIQKEKYNISSRFINHVDVKRLVAYQKQLINIVLYEKIDEMKKKIMWTEIKNIEIFIGNYYTFQYQPIKINQ